LVAALEIDLSNSLVGNKWLLFAQNEARNQNNSEKAYKGLGHI